MKITKVTADLYRVPVHREMHDAVREFSVLDLVLAHVETDEGVSGLGFTYNIIPHGGREICSLINGAIACLIRGLDPRGHERVWYQMWRRMDWVGRGGIAVPAVAAVDIALWDLTGKRQGAPLWRLLGGSNPRVKVYAGGVDLHFSLDALKDQARRFLARGYGAIKMKVGRPRLSEDITRVRAIRELIGPDVPLMVDANMGWTAEQAIRASRALEEFDIYWLEEPTIPDDLAGHVRIAREGALPIATGENFHTLYEFQNFIKAGAVAFPEPDISNCGGITVWMKVAHMAQAHNLSVTSHGVHDLHVHTLAAVPNASYLEGHGFGLEQYLTHPLQIEKGEAIAPDRPGHGVELNWEKLEAHRVK